MAIVFRCIAEGCGRRVKAPDGTEGKKSRCPHCQTSQRVPGQQAKQAAPAVQAVAAPASFGGIDLSPVEEPAPVRSSKIKGLSYNTDAKAATAPAKPDQADGKLYTPYGGADVKVHRQVVAAWMKPASTAAPAKRNSGKGEDLEEYSVGEVSDNPSHERLQTQSGQSAPRKAK